MKVEYKWKLSFFVCLIFLSINQVKAEYVVIEPLEQSQGGSLANGSISFSNTPSTPEVPTQPEEIWVAAAPKYTAWVYNETLHSCNWTPSSNKQPSGFGYTTSQTSTSCSKDKTRSVQAREYNAETDQYRNVSSPTTETITETVASVDSRTIPSTGILGSKVCRYLHPAGGQPATYWETVTTGGNYTETVVWGGSSYNVNNSTNPISMTLVVSYFYTKSVVKVTNGSSVEYEVCRQPITNYNS
jgi:hypothetical protein